jgi:hypothetical protein
VVASAAAACWSPRAAAACVREKLMVAAKAEPGSSAAITMHNTKRMMHLRFLFLFSPAWKRAGAGGALNLML